MIRTHEKISRKLCGEPLDVKDGFAKVVLKTIPDMIADDYGLIHGGFIFGLADYSAMLAVNHPNVVLASANVRFLKPVKLGEELIAEASVSHFEKKKRIVNVKVMRGDEVVFTGEFICAVPEKHVLED
jgi:uncharacterized protein (TIGR00369 family)